MTSSTTSTGPDSAASRPKPTATAPTPERHGHRDRGGDSGPSVPIPGGLKSGRAA